ncbi:MAG: hypothetical protein EPN48_18225 [Microbacteriaceae bacterium]|nr:MAG: hypothetical protein EPN48_18225 [Microbacteriaceae bacterium]
MDLGQTPEPIEVASFSFAAHGAEAAVAYRGVRDFYAELAGAVQSVVAQCLKDRGIPVHRVESRAKEVESFQVKANSRSENDPEVPKYQDPLNEIDDLAGVRIIAYLPNSLHEIDTMLGEEFDVFERSDKSEALIEEGHFGYQSIHYLITFNTRRCEFGEYRKFERALVEIQVRTILQHAWAEIEHDIQYKSTRAIPTNLRRRFMTLAGLLELADREFQAIQDEDIAIKAAARQSLEAGDLTAAVLTPDALRTYLDQRLGSDGRMTEYSYDWVIRLLKGLGYANLGQVECAIRGYDHRKLSRITFGNQRGQVERFTLMLLAAMGDRFIQRHPDAAEDWFREKERIKLESLRSRGIPIRDFDPDGSRD